MKFLRKHLFRLGLSVVLVLAVILGTSIDIGPSVKGSKGIVSLSVNTAVAATPQQGPTPYVPPPQPIIKGTTTFIGRLLNTIRTDNASSSTSNWTNPTNAYADGGGAATVTSGSPSVTQTYGDYHISIAGNVIDSVRVRLDAWTTGTASTNITREATSDNANTGAFTSTNATRYQAINDSSDSSYITGVTNGGGYATFGYSAFTIAANSTISNVAMYYRHRSNTTGTAATSGTVLTVGGTTYGLGGTLNAYTDNGTSSEPASTSAIADRTYYWTINPKSGVAWTADDVNGSGANALQFFGVGGSDFNPDVNFYKCNATVNYTTAANENIELDVTWDGGTTWSSSKHSNPTTGSEVTYWDNVTSDTTWTTAKLTDANFKTRVDALTVGDVGTMNLDWIPVEVTYITLAPPSSFASTSRTSSSIALSWTKGAGADNTTIRYRTDQYPTGTSDGTLAYSGTGTSTNVTSLSAGQIYYFRAWSYNNAEATYSSSYSDLTDYTLPGDPSALAKTSNNDTWVAVSFTKGTGGDKTLIRYKTGSYPSSTSDGTEGYFNTGTSANITGLNPGTTYYWRAWAYDSDSTYYSSGTSDLTQATTGTGWLTGWGYRKKITIAGTTAGAQTDYQMPLNVMANDDANVFTCGWKQYTANSGTLYQYNSQLTQYPNVIKIGSTYFMYYATRSEAGNFDVALSTAATPDAAQADWTFQSLVVQKGAAGKWDVTYVIPTCVLADNGTYYLFYEGSGAAGFAVGYATSADGYTWTKQTVNAPLLSGGSAGQWDDGATAGTPYVVKDGTTYYLFYHGRDGDAAADSLKIGYATATGANLAAAIAGGFTKYGSNPVLSFEGSGWEANWVGARVIFKYGSTWIMIYEAGSAAGAWVTQMGIATSSNLSTWTKYSGNPVFPYDTLQPAHGPSMHGLYVEGNHYYLYYSLLPDSGITSIGLYETEAPDYWDRVVLNGNAQPDFDDIRVTKSDGSTLLHSWLESKTDSNRAKVWVECDSIPNPGPTTFYVYYGNAGASSAWSGSDTFPVFDHFDTAWPTAIWSGDTANGSVVSSILSFGASVNGTGKEIKTFQTYVSPSSSMAMRAYGNIKSDATYGTDLRLEGVNVAAYHIAALHIEAVGAVHIRSMDGATLSDADSNWTADAWKIWDVIVRGGTNTRLVEDGIEKTPSPKTTNPPNFAMGLDIWTDHADVAAIQLDWVLVRNYASPEPTWGTWGAEEPSLTNTPTSKDFGVVTQSSTYYAKGSAPSNPVQDSDCTFTITNSGNSYEDFAISSSNATGGDNWTLTSSAPGSNTFRLTAYYSGQNPASGVVLTNSNQTFYTNLISAGTILWDFKFETGTFTDSVQKTWVITLTASSHY